VDRIDLFQLHSPVTVPIPGTSSIEHLTDNVRAAAVALSQDQYDRLDGLAASSASQR
jgi:aryl-alcohol dehydrogenase-like predicted oxidoreductase